MLPFLTLLLTHLAGVGVSAPTVACDKLPAWSVKDFKVVFGAGQGQSLPTAKTTFTLTGGVAGKSDTISCTMRANSHCQIDGIPSDKNCHIYIQTYLDTYLISFNETISCDGQTSVGYVFGQSTFPLNCPDDNDPGVSKTCTGDPGTVQASLP